MKIRNFLVIVLICMCIPGVCSAATIDDLVAKAARGDTDAQYELGMHYCYGEGVEEDYEKAAYWWIKAAEQGHVLAQYSLNELYYYGMGVEEDEEKSIYWLTKAAEQGDADAQGDLGYFYYYGFRGLEQDYKKAVYWVKKAAEQGHADAQYALGNWYISDGVGPDTAQAVYWLTQAAEQGHNQAQEVIAYIEGVRGYEKTSFGWFSGDSDLQFVWPSRQDTKQALASTKTMLDFLETAEYALSLGQVDEQTRREYAEARILLDFLEIIT
jgi:TPR repeat protein